MELSSSSRILLHCATAPSEEIRQQVMAEWKMINNLALRRFRQQLFAEEAALFVLDSLAKDDWKRIRSCSEPVKFSAFLSSVVYRLLEDFARKKFGRITPPLWLKKMGGHWLKLFHLLCLERFSFLEAIEISQTYAPNIPMTEIEGYAEKILGEVPQCGKDRLEVPLPEDDQLGESSPDRTREDNETAERKIFLEAVGILLFGNEPGEPSLQKPLARLLQCPLQLSAEEKLLLKLSFQENLSPTSAGRILGLNRFQIHGRLRRLLKRIRTHFVQCGYAEELHLLLKRV